MADRALAITGPTASGKTALAVRVARRIGGEIISMDSRQVYRGMDIGTAKPDLAERAGVPHHGFDLVDPDERFSAGRFARFARQTMADIEARGAVPVLAGGTGFFLRALTHPLFREPVVDAARAEAWKMYLRDQPVATLRRWAASLDPQAAPPLADRQRLSRVIECAMLTGQRLSWWHLHGEPEDRPLRPLTFVIDVPRDVLVSRIHARVDDMLRAGLVPEVASLLDQGYNERDPGMDATGYRELIPHLRGERSLEEAAELIRTATRQYARRQMTWFRHQLPADARWLDGCLDVDELTDRVATTWQEAYS